MPVHDILSDLLAAASSSSTARQTAVDPGGGSSSQHSAPQHANLDGRADALLRAFEAECQSQFANAVSADHFTALLCTLLGADLLACYCATTPEGQDDIAPGGESRKMLSCLYSNGPIGFMLCNPIETESKLKAKLEEFRANKRVQSSSSQLPPKMYTVAAAVHIGGTADSQRQGALPLFGSPRVLSGGATSPPEPLILDQRYEEAHLLPIYAMAIACKTLPEALAVIFDAFQPQDPVPSGTTQGSLNLAGGANEQDGAFARAQFERGFGAPIPWITDATLMRNAKLDLDTIEALVSSTVIGLFGTIMNPNILFQNEQTIAVLSSLSRDHTLLSHMGDYFAAGIEYTNNSEDVTSLLTAEPHEQQRTPSPMEAIQKVESFISLPGNVSLFPLNESPSRGASQSHQLPSPKTPVRLPPKEPDSPSFFSPSFADHLTTSNRHDPRIHTVNIPFHLNAPQRSQTYPTTPSPVRSSQGASQFSLKGRPASALRSARRTSEIPTTNLLAIHPHELVDLLNNAKKILVLDIRAFAAYAKSRVGGAINVCIPTVLLKRPSLSLDDVSGSVSESDRRRFAKWKEAEGIVIYDSDSLRVKEAYPLATLAAKFLEAGYEQPTYGITGGFVALLELPDLIDSSPLTNLRSPRNSPSPPRFVPTTLAPKPMAVEAATRLALECKESPIFFRSPTAAHPPGPSAFFANIRQNMDLHGGVGPQIPIICPHISTIAQTRLPTWLRILAYTGDGPDLLAKKWERIELAEKSRLEGVLLGDSTDSRFSIRAAMERGEKNRYPNIWPFEWNRVKVPDVPEEDDYFNGSYVSDGLGRRRYIATQAPLPTTYEDFWKVIWAGGVQVIVCLTAMEEGGQVKCHPYWRQTQVGEMQLMLMNEKSVDLGSGQTAIVRTLMLQNHAEPFSVLREIIQLHYEGWPDFGTPAEAKTIVQLVGVLNDLANPRGSPKPRGTHRNAPVVVHCSAGCGRTGTFCTVDSIIDYLSVRMVERQEEEDLVFRSVSEMREQRMSLVQTLRQYVLCYDCILWYLVNTMRLEEEEEQGEKMLIDGLAD